MESGMRFQLPTTISCGTPPTAILYVVVLTEPHDGEPLCGTTLEPIDHRMLVRAPGAGRLLGLPGVEGADATRILIPNEVAAAGIVAGAIA